MQTGTIIKIFPDKQYGLIRTAGGQEAHFHKHCLWDVRFEDLKENQKVECEVHPSYKGYLAFQIRPISEHTAARSDR